MSFETETPIQCPYCGGQHPAGAKFCPTTGHLLQAVHLLCPHCRAEVNPSATFVQLAGNHYL